MRRLTALLVFLVLITACAPASTLPPAPTATSNIRDAAFLMQLATSDILATNTLSPTNTLMPTGTPTEIVFATNTFQPFNIMASDTPLPTIVVTQGPTPIPINSPTPGADVDASGTPLPTWTPPPLDPAIEIQDHYRFQRPISADNKNVLDRTYPYGGTAGNTMQVHHGVDFENPTGTPILAAGDGVIYYAGDDLQTTFGPTPNYYGNLVVIQHNITASDGRPIFTLYGHMSKVAAEAGEAVKAGDTIGFVGSTGVAIGPHLHFEVRIGDPHDFNSTLNPDLWIYPFQHYGTLAGRVTDANGQLLYQAPITVRAITAKVPHYTWSYPDNTVNGDPAFHENYTLGDLYATYYEVSVNDGQRVRFDKVIYVYPNRTTWLNIQLNP
ncbi:MAG TPA: M23 family metallopeptidase [Phototrophicaceae bacterium]|nr:M23 family metallopeptidase [Phototrophicaceae bacterium]